MDNNFFVLLRIYADLLFACSPLLCIYMKNDKEKVDTRNENMNFNYKIYKKGIATGALRGAVLPRTTLQYILHLEEKLDADISSELKKIFSDFINYIDPVNLEFCLKNLLSIKINYKHSIKEHFANFIAPNMISGFYNYELNKIDIYFKRKYVLSHEFLHMASTCDFNRNLCGFSFFGFDSFTESYDYFGTGLNEGYTELLNRRIFLNGKKTGSYTQNVKIVKLIECFFDNYRDMEYAYFHNDISAVYDAFCRYGTREEFFIIMNELDNYARCFKNADYINSIRVQLKLYEIIKRSNDDKKIAKFESILKDNLGFIRNSKNDLFNFDKIDFGKRRK